MKNVTLRIKRRYFDEILSGAKSVEYRDARPFYDRTFAETPATLTLHYQRERVLRADVVSVSRIPRPAFFSLEDAEETGQGTHVYAIVLRSPRLIRGS